MRAFRIIFAMLFSGGIEMFPRRLEIGPVAFSCRVNVDAVGSRRTLCDVHFHAHAACCGRKSGRADFLAGGVNDVRVPRIAPSARTIFVLRWCGQMRTAVRALQRTGLLPGLRCGFSWVWPSSRGLASSPALIDAAGRGRATANVCVMRPEGEI